MHVFAKLFTTFIFAKICKYKNKIVNMPNVEFMLHTYINYQNPIDAKISKRFIFI